MGRASRPVAHAAAAGVLAMLAWHAANAADQTQIGTGNDAAFRVAHRMYWFRRRSTVCSARPAASATVRCAARRST